MKYTGKVINVLVLLLLVVGSGLSCTRVTYKAPATTPNVKRHGPPPHAPAHGYRAKTSEGVAIVYDSRLRVYVVVGVSNNYYYDGYYYRFNGDHWEAGVKFHGSWQVVTEHKVPPALRSGKKSKRKEKRKE